jgi:hypothetical protein
MAKEIRETLREVAETIGELIDDATTMTVETWYVEMGVDEVPVDAEGKADFRKNAHPLAMTEIKFDGDSVAVLPMRRAADGRLEVDDEARDLHERSVRTATLYRSGLLTSLVGLLKQAV